MPLTIMFLGRLILSAMVVISLKAFSMARSELLMVRRFWYLELPNSSKLAAPVPCWDRHGWRNCQVICGTNMDIYHACAITNRTCRCILLNSLSQACVRLSRCGARFGGRPAEVPCLSWWSGLPRWAAGSEHHPLWRDLWWLSHWWKSSTLNPHQWLCHL